MSTHEELTSSGDHRAHIVAAAEALRTWVRTRHDERPRPVRHETAAASPPVRTRTSSDGTRPTTGAARVAESQAPPPAQHVEPLAATVEQPRESRAVSTRSGSSILSLGAESASADGQMPVPPEPTRMESVWAAAKPILAAAKGPALYWTPRAVAATLVLLVVGGVVVAAVAGSRWVARTYWPTVSATFAAWTAPKTGTAVLESVPPGSQVYVDGALAGIAPMSKELPPGRHLVEFRRGETIRSLEITVTSGQSTVGRLDWNAPRTGILRVESAPAGATVIVDGRDRGVTPLTLNDLAVGTHDVVLQGSAGMTRRTVTIRLDRPTEISEALYSGWLHVSTPIEVGIAEGRRALQLDDQNRILLSPGAHTIQFHNKALGYLETRQVQIEPGETTRVVIAPSPSTLSVTATLHAEVLIDGERVGDTPLANFPIKLGTREVIVRAASGDERKFTLTVSATPVQLNVDFSIP